MALRREPVPAAYRVFFRHIGLDPDVERTPIEAAVLERMLRGGFPTGGLLEDVLLIALLDTGVPVWALDADSLDGPLGIRPSLEGEPLGRSPSAPPLPPGSLVVADASAALAVAVRRARRRARAGRAHAPADAVRGAGRGRARALCRRGAVVGRDGARSGLSGVASKLLTRARARW